MGYTYLIFFFVLRGWRVLAVVLWGSRGWVVFGVLEGRRASSREFVDGEGERYGKDVRVEFLRFWLCFFVLVGFIYKIYIYKENY